MGKFRVPEQIVRVACVQHTCSDRIEMNIESALEHLKEAVRQDAEIICLQELFANPYFPGQKMRKETAADRYSETIDGEIVTRLRRIARDMKIVLVGGSFYEKGTGKDEGQFFNSSPIIDSDGELLGVHRKAHIPNDPGYWEKRYFNLGDRLATVAETAKGKIAVATCWDQWYSRVPEFASDNGAALLLYPTAIGHTNDETSGYIPGDSGNWDRKLYHMISGDAARNSMYIGVANRIGLENDTTFFGGSGVYDHVGDPQKKLGSRNAGVVVSDCSFGHPPVLRKAWGLKRRKEIEE